MTLDLYANWQPIIERITPKQSILEWRRGRWYRWLHNPYTNMWLMTGIYPQPEAPKL